MSCFKNVKFSINCFVWKGLEIEALACMYLK